MLTRREVNHSVTIMTADKKEPTSVPDLEELDSAWDDDSGDDLDTEEDASAPGSPERRRNAEERAAMRKKKAQKRADKRKAKQQENAQKQKPKQKKRRNAPAPESGGDTVDADATESDDAPASPMRRSTRDVVLMIAVVLLLVAIGAIVLFVPSRR